MTTFTQYINVILHTYDNDGYGIGRYPFAIEELQKKIVEDSPIYEYDPEELTLEFEYDESLPFLSDLKVDKLYALFLEVKFTAWVNDDREGESDYEIKQLKIRELPIDWLEDFEQPNTNIGEL